MNKNIVLTLFCGFIWIAYSCNNPSLLLSKSKEVIDSVKSIYAPDSRTAIFDINPIVSGNTVILNGETNIPEAKTALTEALQHKNLSTEDKINVLPGKDIGAHAYAIVNNSVANLRSEAKHSAELVTQATMGTPLKVYKQQGNWSLVQMPDQYIAWVDGGGIHLTNAAQMASYKASPKLIYLKSTGHLYDTLDTKMPVADVVAGSILTLTDSSGAYYHTQLPDGKKAYLNRAEAMPYHQWVNKPDPTGEDLVETAFSLKGIPYLWGGTSTKGVDCSGFTKTVYFMHGFILPRDASQQIYEGKVADKSGDFNELKLGDLLFFGQPATDSKDEKVVHVGMWIGNNRFIHASGNVHVSSVDSTDQYYDEYNLNRYLRSVRILGEEQTSGVLDLRKDKVYR